MRTIEFVVSPINLGIHRGAGVKLHDDAKFAGSMVVINVYDQITGLHLISETTSKSLWARRKTGVERKPFSNLTRS